MLAPTRLVAALKRHPRRLAGAAFAAALLLSLPSLAGGFVLDDWVHLYAARGFPGIAGGLSLFDFTPAEPGQLQAWIARGPYPWWTNPDFRIRFFRPLSSALIQGDNALFGDAAALYHAHSIAWGLALVAAGWLVYRRLLPGLTGAVALCFFALSEAHWMPTVWLASRNTLVAAVPALLGFAAHLRWRRDGWRWGAPLSALGYAVGLAGGETALAMLAFPLAWEWLAATDSRASRLKAAAPAGLVLVAWVALYKLLGYGTSGSGMYLDPTAEPLRWLAAAPGRFAAMVGFVTLNAPVELWLPLPAVRPVLMGVGVLALGLFGWLGWRALRGLPEAEQRVGRALAVGTLVSLLPFLSVFPSSRLGLVASVGGAGVLALLARDLWRRRARVLLGLLLATHLAGPVFFWLSTTGFWTALGARADAAYAGVELEPNRTELSVVVLTSPDAATFIYTPVARAVRGLGLPRAWWILTHGPGARRLTRSSEAALEIASVEGRMLDTVFEQVVWTPARPFSAGDTVALDGARVEVLAVDDGHPTRVRFTSDVPLDAERLRLLVWRDGGFRRFPLPPVGETVALPDEPGPMAAAP